MVNLKRNTSLLLHRRTRRSGAPAAMPCMLEQFIAPRRRSYEIQQRFWRPMSVDTHCHLDDPALLSRLPEVLTAAAQAGVARIVVPGVGPVGWPAIAALARQAEGVSAAFGLHPMHAGLYAAGL